MKEDTVNPEQLFDYLLKVLEFFGYHLQYPDNWKAVFAKIKAFYFSVIAFFTSSIFLVYFIVQHVDELNTVIANVAPMSSATVMLIKFGTFYFARDRFKNLIDDLIRNSKKGDFGVQIFEKF